MWKSLCGIPRRFHLNWDVTVSTPVGNFTRPFDRTGHFTTFGGAR